MGPTIIIGLGGVGSEIVAMVEKRMFDLPEDSFKKLQPLLRFAIIDTDVNALRERKRQDFRGAVVQISDNMTVEKYLHYDPDAKEWFPPCRILSTKTMTEGAGQVRAISRLTLNLALQKQDNFRPLYDAIDDLHLLRKGSSDQPTRVVIVSSLAGGTGSGIFLPFAMHLQEYLRKNYRNTEPIFKGFFIMPSMFDFFAGEAERRSLNANGYASTRELNAFTMMRDHQIDVWQYPYLKIDLQDGHARRRTYRKSPYDLCFLFEKQNQDDKHLNGFLESKRNVANCVWLQTVNPVLEQNGSLEDNLYKIVSTTGSSMRYERFAGMGIAQLVYPYKEMEPYFSMIMADAILRDNWYAADIAWEESLERLAVNGEFYQQSEKEEFYMEHAERDSEWKDNIRPVKDDAWVENYLEAVDTLIEARSDKGAAVQDAMDAFDIMWAQNSPDAWTESGLVYIKNSIERFRHERRKSVAKNLGYMQRQLIENLNHSRGKQVKWDDHRIERWLLGNGMPGTPVENRYFLAQLLKELPRRCKEMEKKAADAESTARTLESALEGFKSMPRSRSDKNSQKIPLHLKQVLEAIADTAMLNLKLETWKELRRMVKNLWTVYEELLRQYTSWVNSEKAGLRKNLIDIFAGSDGRTIRLVCASEVCLNKMEALVKASARSRNYTDLFAGKLCQEVLRQADRGEDADAGRLKEFWNQQYLRGAGSALDVDVLSALENEARWEYEAQYHKPLDKSSIYYNDTIKHYMEDHAFHEVREIFVRAFLRIPNIKQRHTLKMCIYPSGIPKDNVLLQEIVREQLDANHGIEDKESGSEGKYQIDFYRAVFGVSAGEVSTFLCESLNSPIPSGDSYNDYATMVGSLDWQNRRENFLTPHIDWRWHKVSAIPDLSGDLDRRRNVNLLLSAFYGLLSGKIRFDGREYKIGIIDGQTFDRPENPIRNFNDLVDVLDESPVISVGILEDLRASREKERVTAGFAGVVDAAIREYCERRLDQDFSPNEQAEILAEAILELVFIVEIKDKCREMTAATAKAAAAAAMALSGEKPKTFKTLVQDRLEEKWITQWLKERMG